MGYQEIIPPERLEEFKKLGPSEVQAKLDAGLYSGNHERDAILFMKLCESEREAAKQTRKPVAPWYKKWSETIVLGLIIGLLIIVVASWIGLR